MGNNQTREEDFTLKDLEKKTSFSSVLKDVINYPYYEYKNYLDKKSIEKELKQYK